MIQSVSNLRNTLFLYAYMKRPFPKAPYFVTWQHDYTQTAGGLIAKNIETCVSFEDERYCIRLDFETGKIKELFC